MPRKKPITPPETNTTPESHDTTDELVSPETNTTPESHDTTDELVSPETNTTPESYDTTDVIPPESHNTTDELVSPESHDIEQSYQLANCSLDIHIRITPVSDNARRIVMGLKSHAEDVPIFTAAQITDLSSVQSVFDELLGKFQAQLPQRMERAIARYQASEPESEVTPPNKPGNKSKGKSKPAKNELPQIAVEDATPDVPATEKVQLSLF